MEEFCIVSRLEKTDVYFVQVLFTTEKAEKCNRTFQTFRCIRLDKK